MRKLLSYKYIYLIPLLASAIFSLRSFRLKWPKPFRIFSIFLWTTFLVEAFAIAWKWGLCKTGPWNFSPNNVWIYCAFITIRHLFFLAYFHAILENELVKKIIRWSVVPFLVFAVLNYFYIQTPFDANTYTMIIANSFTIFLVLIFFQEILRSKKIIRLGQSTQVWIAFGTFIYYSGTLPLFIFFNYLMKYSPGAFSSYYQINDALNIIMYTSYLIAFLCKPHSLK